MSDLHQCENCRLRNYLCGHYDQNNTDPCSHFEMPIDNSRMFSHWYSKEGRSGRLEYFCSLLIAWVLGGILWFVGSIMVSNSGIVLDTWISLRIYLLIIFGPSLLLIWLAGIKRAHDSGAPEWLASAPVVFLVYPHLFTFVFALLCTIYLLKDPGEEGINEYGSNPAQPYESQLEI